MEVHSDVGVTFYHYNQYYRFYAKVHKYWNQWYHIIEEDAPELLDEFIRDTAKRYGVSRKYIETEFIT